MAIRWKRSAIEEWSLPDHRSRAAPAESAGRWEERAGLRQAARCAIAPGAATSNAETSRLHINSPAAARIEKKPGTPPTQQPPPQSVEGSASQKVARSKKEETRQEKRWKGRAAHRGGR